MWCRASWSTRTCSPYGSSLSVHINQARDHTCRFPEHSHEMSRVCIPEQTCSMLLGSSGYDFSFDIFNSPLRSRYKAGQGAQRTCVAYRGLLLNNAHTGSGRWSSSRAPGPASPSRGSGWLLPLHSWDMNMACPRLWSNITRLLSASNCSWAIGYAMCLRRFGYVFLGQIDG